MSAMLALLLEKNKNICPKCNGNKRIYYPQPGAGWELCNTCNGKGWTINNDTIKIIKQTILDILQLFEYTGGIPLYGQDIRDQIKSYAKENGIEL